MATRRRSGCMLAACGVALPAVAYFAGHVFNWIVASFGGPPNQGAMVLAYLAFKGSLFVGGLFVVVGLIAMATAEKD